jgi:DNA-binding beta-propeller fold protein YncE
MCRAQRRRIDVAQRRLTHEIPTVRPNHSGIAALARTANGRQVLALPRGGGPISVFDPEQDRIIARVEAGFGAAAMVPSGTGRYLLVPNTIEATLTVFRSESFSDPVSLPGGPGVTGVYTAWLDSIAFMPDSVRQSVLMYDLDSLSLVSEIALRGRPGPGAVTPDSRTLYLPVLDPPRVVAIDAASREVAAVFDIAEPPLAALVAGGWGIFH